MYVYTFALGTQMICIYITSYSYLVTKKLLVILFLTNVRVHKLTYVTKVVELNRHTPQQWLLYY